MPKPDARARLAQHCAIARFVASHALLALSIVREQGGSSIWQALDESRSPVLPSVFERDGAPRSRHHAALFARAASSEEPCLLEHHGFSDYACFLDESAGERLFLVARECASAPLDYKALERGFAASTGTTPLAANTDFARYVQVALSRPVLTSALRAELAAFCELFRNFCHEGHDGSGQAPALQPAQDRLSAGVIAIALAPIDAGRAGREPLRALVEARRLAHELSTFAHEQQGWEAVALEDYGVLLTIPLEQRAKTPPKAAEARKLAERLRQLAQTRLGLSTVAGSSITLGAPEARDGALERAVLALRAALESGQSVLLLEEASPSARTVRHSHVAQALERLCGAFERQAMTEAAAMAHAFIQTVTRFSGGRLDIVRLEYVLAVSQIAKAIQRRHCLNADMPARWGDETSLKLDACASEDELSEELRSTLNRLGALATSSDGPSYLRIEELLDYLRHNLTEPVKLPHLARRTGFSVPSFCRVFKRATGHSLLTYVRGLRIGRAKHLLATTELPNNSVAELSGFHSQHHFIRSFKKVMRSTPGEYRRALGVGGAEGGV
jgi:AraC-like DNA-binding protein